MSREDPRLQHSSRKGSVKLVENPWAKITCWKGLTSQPNRPALVPHGAPSPAESRWQEGWPQSDGFQQWRHPSIRAPCREPSGVFSRLPQRGARDKGRLSQNPVRSDAPFLTSVSVMRRRHPCFCAFMAHQPGRL